MNKILNKVIGIGASAGGLDAIKKLFSSIPSDSGHSFIVIQHLSPDYKTLMPELLAKRTDMQIFMMEDEFSIQPNCIYLNKSNKNVEISGDRLISVDRMDTGSPNLPIDLFFHSLGRAFKEDAVGIVLSGTGSDGSRGVKTISEQGGIVLVQSPASAQFDGMPKSAIGSGLVDFVLPPEEIGKTIADYSAKNLETLFLKRESIEQSFLTLLKEIYQFGEVDFKQYKRNTLVRRLEKRIHINGLDSLPDYLELVKNDESERAQLFFDFLIGVTSFFRDKPAYEQLSTEVFPKLLANKDPGASIRVWVPACSTGEEAYSIAMALHYFIHSRELHVDFKIFATDINEESLSKASNGRYAAHCAEEINPDYLAHYFIKTDDYIEVAKIIKDHVVFSKNDLTKDPPFIKLDLISCRNALIYLNNEAQNHIIGHFLFALNMHGFLFLGSSESLGGYENDFHVIDGKWKLFQTKYANTRRFTTTKFDFGRKSVGFSGVNSGHEVNVAPFHKYISELNQLSLVFLDVDYNIRFIKGDLGQKISPREGVFQQNILKMVDSTLAAIIRNSIRKLESGGKPVSAKNVSLGGENDAQVFDLTFTKTRLSKQLDPIYVIQFGEDRVMEQPIKTEQLDISNSIALRIEDLENELKSKDEELRNLIEQLETSNEELQSSNEELMAANEELQSTNEELQSVNEELYTVNSELQDKNSEIQGVYDDLNNLYFSQEIATVFLDRTLCIRLLTPTIKELLKFKDSDIGRPISNFMFFDYDTRLKLIEEAQKSVESGSRFEMNILDQERNYILRIHPFLKDSLIDGVIISMLDVHELISAKNQLIVAEHQYERLFENMNSGFALCELVYEQGKPVDLVYKKVNPEFEHIIGLKESAVPGKSIGSFLSLKNEVKDWIDVAHETCDTGSPQTITIWLSDFEKYLRVQVFVAGGENTLGFTFYDVTEKVIAENKIKEANENYENLFENINALYSHFKIVLDKDGNPGDLVFVDVNTKSCDFYKETREAIIGKSMNASNNIQDAEFEGYLDVSFEVARSGTPQSFYSFTETTGQHWMSEVYSPKEMEAIFVSLDISEQHDIQKEIEATNTRLNLAINVGKHAIWEWNVEEDRIENFNDNWRVVYEMDPERISEQFDERIFEEDKKITWATINEHIEKKTDRYKQVFRIWDKKMEKCKWIQNAGKVIEWNVDGSAKRVIGASSDISEQKDAETKVMLALEQLREEKKFKDSITESSTSGIYIYDFQKGKNVYSNLKCSEILGYTTLELLNMDSEMFASLFHPDDLEDVITHGKLLEVEKTERSIQYRFRRKDGKYVSCFSVDTPYEFNDDGSLKSYLGSFIDITEMHEKEEELTKTRNEAISANRQKDLFLANMSHEIRTPMNAVLGFSKLLKRPNLSKSTREKYLYQIEENSNQLLTIIDDVLNITKIESDQMHFEYEVFSLDSVLAELAEVHMLHLEKLQNKNKIAITYNSKKEIRHLRVKLDKIRFSQIINNLITNAIKYSKKGMIEVGTELLDQHIKIYVKDEGVGIKKDQQSMIFDRFSQTNVKLNAQAGGIGLGLAIAKSLTNAMGGTIHLESRYHHGSTFYLLFPLEIFIDDEAIIAENVNNQENNQVSDISDKLIIIADDNESIRFYYEEILSEYGPKLLFADNGLKVVDLVKEHPEVDLVLMDIRMPEMDGPTAMKEILKINKEARVVAQSAFAMPDQIEEFKKLGFTEYLTKPIEEDKVLELLVE